MKEALADRRASDPRRDGYGVLAARALALLALSSAAWAQGLSVGLRVGVLPTPPLAAAPPQRASAAAFTFGPGIEIPLRRGVALGVDLLFRRFEVAPESSGPSHARIRQWEAPITLAYRFRRARGLFLRGGVSVNRVFDIAGAEACGQGPFGERFYCVEGRPLMELRHRGAAGFVLGGGVRVKVLRWSLEPEFRWTHWWDRNFGVRDSAVRSNLEQAGFYLGLLF